MRIIARRTPREFVAARAAAFALAGAPERRLNKTLRGFARLPLRVRAR
jgi:hypothetical protein